MTHVLRSMSAVSLFSVLAACSDPGPMPAASGLDGGFENPHDAAIADAGADAASQADGSGGGIIIVPLFVDFCGDGIDQDGDGTADDDCNRVFVATIASSLEAYAASGHLLEAADGACANAASSAGLAGNFVAYLSTPSTSARSRLGSARGFVRVDGKPIADTAADFANGQLRYPIALAASGLTGASVAVTVSTSGGLYDANASCNTMADFVNGLVSVGASQAGGSSFQSDGSAGCGAKSFAVYCVQTDHQTPLAAPSIPANAHRVFVSEATFHSGGGLASADALCATEASAEGLAGQYVAFLPTASTSASSRITNDGAPVVRVDGVVVASTTQAFFARIWSAPIATTASGASFAGSVGMWTAAPSPLIESDGNCNDYTSTSALSTASIVVTNRIWGQTQAGAMGCDVDAAHVVCLRK